MREGVREKLRGTVGAGLNTKSHPLDIYSSFHLYKLIESYYSVLATTKLNEGLLGQTRSAHGALFGG